MQNDPTLKPKYLGEISSDFVKVCDLLKETAYAIIKNDFSKHPIFFMSKEQQPIGELLIEKNQLGNQWYYYASFLEAVEELKLVTKKEQFIEAYHNPEEFACLFVVDNDFNNFVYIPYPED